MSQRCEECTARGAYTALADSALRLDRQLRTRFTNEEIAPGGCLFLGKHYGHSRSILFTLNPTPNPERFGQPIDFRLFESNIHWEGPTKGRYRNWTFSRHLFTSMVASAPWFRPTLERATDAFIIPWASRDWTSMVRSPAWKLVREYSRTVFEQTMVDCRPNLIFISGKTTGQIFWSFLGVPRPTPIAVRRSPSLRNYDAEWYRLQDVKVGQERIGELTVIRLPHFSRGSYQEFAAVGEWVAERLPRA